MSFDIFDISNASSSDLELMEKYELGLLIFTVIESVAVIGSNSYFLLTFSQHQRLLTAMNWYVVSLCLSGVITGFVIPTGIGYHVGPYTATFSLLPCVSQKIKGSVNYATSVNNVFCMFAIAIERWRSLASCKRRNSSSLTAKRVVAVIGMLSVALSSVLGWFARFQDVRLSRTYTNLSGDEPWEDQIQNGSSVYQLCYLFNQGVNGYRPVTTQSFNIVVGFMMPVLAMAVIYTVLISRLLKDIKRSRDLLGTLTSTQRAKLRAIQAMVLVLALFVICWLPCHLLNLWTAIRGSPNRTFRSKVLHDASNHLAVSHHWLHTVIYPAYSHQLTNALKETGACLIGRRYKTTHSIELKSRTIHANGSLTDLATGS